MKGLTAMDLSIAFKMILIMASVAAVCAVIIGNNFFKSAPKNLEGRPVEVVNGAGQRGTIFVPDDFNVPLSDFLLEKLLEDVTIRPDSTWQTNDQLRRSLRYNIRRFAGEQVRKMVPVHGFLGEVISKRSAQEQVEMANQLAERDGPICGHHNSVGYVCNLRPNHEGRHSLKMDGESFLYWDDPDMKAKAMQPPV